MSCSLLCSCSGLRPRQAAQQGNSLSTGAVLWQVGIQYVSPVHEFPEDKWDAIIDVCLNSAFHATKAALPYMVEQQWGRSVMQQDASSECCLLAAALWQADWQVDSFLTAESGCVSVPSTARSSTPARLFQYSHCSII